MSTLNTTRSTTTNNNKNNHVQQPPLMTPNLANAHPGGIVILASVNPGERTTHGGAISG